MLVLVNTRTRAVSHRQEAGEVGLTGKAQPTNSQAPLDTRRVATAHECLVTVLLCTYNGAEFLSEQLASIERQTHRNWRIIASDDGSIDSTPAILTAFAEAHRGDERMEIRHGPRRGPAANFLSLATDPRIAGDYFAFCDQDDIWFPEKLERALAWLTSIDAKVPALYCSRTQIINAAGQPIGSSPLFCKPLSFRNALVQSIAGANTMVFNDATRKLLSDAPSRDAVSHDWWAYLLVSAVGGELHYDPVPTVAYRQHAKNHIGSNRGAAAAFRRVKMLVQGGWSAWNDRNFTELARSDFLFDARHKEILRDFETFRRGSVYQRLGALYRLQLYRQTLTGQLTLWLATVLRKM
jgi:glycosyltransferase involved in cell wall biosynthesis